VSLGLSKLFEKKYSFLSLMTDLKAVFSEMGLNVRFQPIDWKMKETELNGKNIDVIWNGLTITEKRQEEISFSDVYLEDRQIIVVQKESAINTKKDLAGKVVGLQLGSSSEAPLLLHFKVHRSELGERVAGKGQTEFRRTWL